MKEKLDKVIDSLIESYNTDGGINHIDGLNLPNRQEVIDITWEILRLIFPGFFCDEHLTSKNYRYLTEYRAASLLERLVEQIERSLKYACSQALDCKCERCHNNSTHCTMLILEEIPSLRKQLSRDIDAAFAGDPACYSREEAILCYPGVMAIAVQRIANILQKYRVPLLPRIMTEYIHCQTGVDIHPGATIGNNFFMDHATGIVIGETTVIGDNVKLYQGVTLGAKSFPDDAREARGAKRHPTIEDGVIIYANAAILGDITIGKGAIIGGNTWITHDVAPGQTITIEPPKMRIR